MNPVFFKRDVPEIVEGSVKLSHPTQLETFSKETYFPRFKPEDKLRAQLYEKGITNREGKVNPQLAHLDFIPLEEEERVRLQKTLEKVFSITHHSFDFGIKTSCTSLLQDFLTNSDLALLFKNFAVIGSTTFHILGLSFFKRFSFFLFKLAFPNKEENEIGHLVDEIFTSEFTNHLEKKLNQIVSDLDLRLKCISPPKDKTALQRALDKFVDIVEKKMPPLSAEKKGEALDKLKKGVTCKDFSWLKIDDPRFAHIVVRNLAFEKLVLINKGKNRFSIATLGNQKEMRVDFVLVLELLRCEIFPSLEIPFGNLFQPHLKDSPLFPTGEKWVQALLDKMCGYVRPDISLATEDDLKILMCRYTKGDTNPVDGSEIELIKIAKNASIDFQNKTVRKVLEEFPDLQEDITKIFPHFLLRIFQEAVETHLDRDPLAAISLTLNAVRLLQNFLSFEDLQMIVEGMKTYWTKLSKDQPENHLLFLMAELVTEERIPEKENAIIKKMPLFKMCAFLGCHTAPTDGEIKIYPRTHDGRPFFEICLKSGSKTYSLLLDFQNPEEILKDTLKYFFIPKTKDLYKVIETILERFFPKNPYQGVASSPLFQDLKFFNLNIKNFEEMANTCLAKVHPLFGLQLFFATQTLSNVAFSLNQIFLSLPILLSHYPKQKDFILNNLELLLKDKKIKALEAYRQFLEKKTVFVEKELTMTWLDLLSQEEIGIPYAYEGWVYHIGIVAQRDSSFRQNSAQILFRNMKWIYPSFALKMLQQIQQKTSLSIHLQVELYEEIFSAILNNPEEIVRLEKLGLTLWKGIKDAGLKEKFKATLKKIPDNYQTPPLREITQKIHNEEKVEPFEDTVFEIKTLLSQDYEEAVARFHSRYFSFMPKIIEKCCENQNLPLAIQLLKKQEIQDTFQSQIEPYFLMLLHCLEKSQSEDDKFVLLELILKNYTDQRVPFATSQVLAKIAHHIKNALELRLDPPQQFLRTFRQGFSTFFQALQVHHLHKEGLRLCEFLPLSFLIDFEGLIIQSLIEGFYPTKEILDLSQTLVDLLLKNKISRFAKEKGVLLRKLLIYAENSERIFLLIQSLKALQPLHSQSDLEALFACFEKLIQNGDPHSAFKVLRNFKGKIPSQDFEKSFDYYKLITQFFDEKNWQLATLAIASDPFQWSKTSIINRLRFYSGEVLRQQVQKEMSLEYLCFIFKIAKEHEILTIQDLEPYYEKCEGPTGPDLFQKMWFVFEQLLFQNGGNTTLEKIGLCSLSALRRSFPKQIEEIFSKEKILFAFCKCITKEKAFEAYTLLWKCWKQILKSKRVKPVEMFKQIAETLPEFADKEHLFQKQVHFVELYLNRQQLAEAIDHFMILLDLAPENKSYFILLEKLIDQLGKAKGDFSSKQKEISLITLEASKRGLLPFTLLKLIHHFSNFSTPKALKEGIRILFSILKVPTFSLEQLKMLKTVPFSQFLETSIKHLDHTIKSELEGVLCQDKIRLLIPPDKRACFILELAKFYLNEADLEQAIQFTIAHYGTLISLEKELLDNFLIRFFQKIHALFFEGKEDQLFLKILQTLEGHTLFFQLLLESGKKLKQPGEISRLKLFVEYHLDRLNAILIRKESFSKSEQEQLTIWIVHLFMVKDFKPFAESLVQKLDIPLFQKNYPSFLCELFLFLGIFQENFTQESISKYKDEIPLTLAEIPKHFYKYLEYDVAYELVKKLFHLVSDWVSPKSPHFIDLLNCLFVLSYIQKSKKKEEAFKEIVEIWVNLVVSQDEMLTCSLHMDDAAIGSFALICIGKKIMGLLDYMKTHSLGNKFNKIAAEFYSTFTPLYGQFLNEFANGKPGDITIEEDLAQLKILPQVYLTFFQETRSKHSPELRFIAFDHYLRLLKLLMQRLQSKFIVSDQKFFEDLFSRSDDFILNLRDVKGEKKKEIEFLSRIVVPQLKKEYRDIVGRHRR